MQLSPFKFETVRVDGRGEVIERLQREAQVFQQPLDRGINLELVQLPGGLCQIGSPIHQGYDDEHPQHPAYIPSFFIGKFLVTQEQWKAVMGKDLPYRRVGPLFPADRASWKDANAFCRRLGQKSGLAYRLPSEAEWEYACRAGSNGPFYCGPTLTTALANYCGDHVFGEEAQGVYRHGTTVVGSFPANGFGLFDMHGNLWEWCADDWFEDYSGAGSDSQARSSGKSSFKVARGGSWHETPNHCRSAVRLKFGAGEGDDYVGFRIVLSKPAE